MPRPSWSGLDWGPTSHLGQIRASPPPSLGFLLTLLVVTLNNLSACPVREHWGEGGCDL